MVHDYTTKRDKMRTADNLFGTGAGELDKKLSGWSSFVVQLRPTNLSYGLGTLRDSVLSQFTREN